MTAVSWGNARQELHTRNNSSSVENGLARALARFRAQGPHGSRQREFAVELLRPPPPRAYISRASAKMSAANHEENGDPTLLAAHSEIVGRSRTRV